MASFAVLATGGAAGAVLAQTIPNASSLPSTIGSKVDVPQQIPITIVVNGRGKVRLGGTPCGPTATQKSASCVRMVSAGQRITFTAVPDTHHALDSFAGPCTRIGNDCALTVAGPATVSATFIRPQRTLTITYRERAGQLLKVMANGPLTSGCTPKVLNQMLREMTCVRSFPAGTTVNISAQRPGSPPLQPPYNIMGARWAGACAGTPGMTCALILDVDNTVIIDPNFP